MPRGRKKIGMDTVNDEYAGDLSIGPIDAHVGSRIADRRKLLQISQKQLAQKLGVTFQQVQKYEKGVNRIGAGRLYSIAMILGVDVGYFYTDIDINVCRSLKCMQDVALSEESRTIKYLREDKVDFAFDPFDSSESVMLLKSYYALPTKARDALLQMLAGLNERYEADDD